jgi:hypothetical protein
VCRLPGGLDVSVIGVYRMVATGHYAYPAPTQTRVALFDSAIRAESTSARSTAVSIFTRSPVASTAERAARKELTAYSILRCSLNAPATG